MQKIKLAEVTANYCQNIHVYQFDLEGKVSYSNNPDSA